jgi:hypothetical protein
MGSADYFISKLISGSPPVECCWPRAGVNRRLKQEFFAQQGSCDG